MGTTLGQQLQACGRHSLPKQIRVAGESYALVRVFKHDFFACTALYGSDHEGPAQQRVVLKIGRLGDFMGLPLAWLGKLLCRHEWEILSRLKAVSDVPKLLGRYGPTGFVYGYIEGQSLDERADVGDDFFDKLADLLTRVHAHRIAYIDMNKRGNILAGTDGRPRLIDFQISLHIGPKVLGSVGLAERVLGWLGQEDIYHLNKHKRRIRKDLMSDSDVADSRKKSQIIQLHRKVSRPLTRLRRRVLAHLFHRGHVITDDTIPMSRESDPQRWQK